MDKLFKSFAFWFFLLGTIVFWFFIVKGGIYDNWYPMVGHLVASHGGLISMIVYHIYYKK